MEIKALPNRLDPDIATYKLWYQYGRGPIASDLPRG